MSENKDTYQKLVDAAYKCFAEKGFAATSIKEISRQAGISQGAMYTYFSSKDELIIEIVLEEQRIALASYDQPYDCSNLDRICDLFFSCIGRSPSYPKNHNPLWIEIMAESARNNVLRDHFISSDIIMRKGIEIFITRGIDAGEFRHNLAVNEMTLIIFAMLDGLMGRKAINDAFDFEKEISGFKSILKSLLS